MGAEIQPLLGDTTRLPGRAERKRTKPAERTKMILRCYYFPGPRLRLTDLPEALEFIRASIRKLPSFFKAVLPSGSDAAKQGATLALPNTSR